MLETVHEEEHLTLYSDLIEPVLTLLLHFVKEQREEDDVYLGFDIIMNILEGSSTLLDNFLPNLVSYVLSENFLLNKRLNANFKECGLDFLGVIAEYRRSILTKNA